MWANFENGRTDFVEEEIVVPLLFFLGALLKFTIEKKLFILPVPLSILYSRKNNNHGQLNDKMNTQKNNL